MTKLLLPPTAQSSSDDAHTDDNARRLAEILHAYDPRLSLEYIPEADKTERSLTAILSPYRIVRITPELGREVVRYISGEQMKKPSEVLAWLWEGDFTKHHPREVINKIELKERAERMLNLKREQDLAEERQDKLAWGIAGGRDKKHRLQLGRGKFLNI